jgi:hypothetical protein
MQKIGAYTIHLLFDRDYKLIVLDFHANLQ